MKSSTVIVFYLIILLTGIAISGYSNGTKNRRNFLPETIQDQLKLHNAKNILLQMDSPKADCKDNYFHLFFYECKDRMAMNLFPKVTTKKVDANRYLKDRKYVFVASCQKRNQRKC